MQHFQHRDSAINFLKRNTDNNSYVHFNLSFPSSIFQTSLEKYKGKEKKKQLLVKFNIYKLAMEIVVQRYDHRLKIERFSSTNFKVSFYSIDLNKYEKQISKKEDQFFKRIENDFEAINLHGEIVILENKLIDIANKMYDFIAFVYEGYENFKLRYTKK